MWLIKVTLLHTETHSCAYYGTEVVYKMTHRPMVKNMNENQEIDLCWAPDASLKLGRSSHYLLAVCYAFVHIYNHSMRAGITFLFWLLEIFF